MADDPGEWEDIADEHVPMVFINKHASVKHQIRVGIPLPLKSPGHCIEKIGMTNKAKEILMEKSFHRNDRTQAEFKVEPELLYTKGIKVFAKCNLHDVWIVKLQDVVDAGGRYGFEQE